MGTDVGHGTWTVRVGTGGVVYPRSDFVNGYSRRGPTSGPGAVSTPLALEGGPSGSEGLPSRTSRSCRWVLTVVSVSSFPLLE